MESKGWSVFFRRVCVAVFVLLLFFFVWGFGIEPARLVTRRADVSLPEASPLLDGLRIAVISDLHAGAPHIGLEKIDLVVRRINEENPDLILLLGDFLATDVLGGSEMAPEPVAARLGGLRAPAGVFAVLGNHDWWSGGDRIRGVLENAGIVVLENEFRPVPFRGQSFWLAGIADEKTRHPDVDRLIGAIPEGAPILAMTHNPDLFSRISARVALTLAGHTHGGQVWLPFIGRPIVPSRFGQRYALGHVVEKGRHLFVTTGIGTSMIPIRFGVPPEIAMVTIRVPGAPRRLNP